MRLTYLTLSYSVGKAVRIFKMAAFAISCFKHFTGRNCSRLKTFFQGESVFLNHARYNHMFRYLEQSETHGKKYAYEVSRDPKEWEFVERILPLETIPIPKPKEKYPSGWRPPTEEAMKHPYYVERTENQMLPVYLNKYNRGFRSVTRLKNIHGDIWKLHDELKDYIQTQQNSKIGSAVLEGNCKIYFHGDVVYYVEQFLLSKGF